MSYLISDIASKIKGIIDGDSSLIIERLSPFFQAGENDLTFAADEKFLSNISATKAKVILVPDIKGLPEGKTYIKVNRNPREIMPIILDIFSCKLKKPQDMLESTAKIGENVEISPGVYIGYDVEIGENTKIYPNVVIMEGSKIGKNCIIYPNVTIREACIIGDNVILQPGAVIGSDGFGYIKIEGKNKKLEQIGRVIIENDVELGANTAVDRGAIGDTIIKKGTKIDNLVHIAHNDIIGENCLIIAQVGISGSVEIGNNTTIAGQTGVAGHLKIGNNVTIAAKSGVTNDIPDNMKVSGYPVRNHTEDLKIKVAAGKLPEIIKKVKELENKIGGK